MGLLDDAIREHLELKRRRGDDPAAIARLEQEAFGPIRRGDAALEASGPPRMEALEEPAPHHDFEPVADLHEHTPPHGDPLEEEMEGATVEYDVDAHLAAEATPAEPAAVPEAEPRPAAPIFDDDADELFAEPQPPAEADEDAEDDADVLEETPDFLAETPDHERLWFEQQPPRDFDI